MIGNKKIKIKMLYPDSENDGHNFRRRHRAENFVLPLLPPFESLLFSSKVENSVYLDAAEDISFSLI